MTDLPSTRRSLVVVAARLPVEHSTAGDGGWRRSQGGLADVLRPILSHTAATWVGWAGGTGPAPRLPDVDGVRLCPVYLSAQDFQDFYAGFANSTLWPLYHDAVEPPAYHRRWWEAYQRVNQRFADLTAEVAEPGTVVWVQDYHLQLVPALLRARRPDLRIGFFLHVPFPPAELFMQLPRRAELVRGLLGADLIGFQREHAAHNFRLVAAKLGGASPSPEGVHFNGRHVRLAAFPVSIDSAEIAAVAAKPEVAQRVQQLRASLGHPHRIILGVDRMDHTKGIELRLKAMRELLAEHRIKAEDTTMVQVVVPNGHRVERHRALRRRIEREVGRINGEFAQLNHAPVHYLSQAFDRAELIAFYRAADVMAVTPLRDGMNLVAKEFVAARVDGGGTLVLSEFAGAAAELTQAFRVNPHDLDALKDTLIRALEAAPDDARERMAAMRAHVREHDIHRWARSYLAILNPQSPRA